MSRVRSITNGAPVFRAAATSFSACLSVCRSDPHIPHASVLTSTSPAPGTGVGMLSTTSFLPRIMAARMTLLLHPSSIEKNDFSAVPGGALNDRPRPRFGYSSRVAPSLVKSPPPRFYCRCLYLHRDCNLSFRGYRDGPQDFFHHHRSAALRRPRMHRPEGGSCLEALGAIVRSTRVAGGRAQSRRVHSSEGSRRFRRRSDSADASKNQTRDRVVNCYVCNCACGMLAVPFQSGNAATKIYRSDESRQWRAGQPDLAQHGCQQPRRLCAQPGNAAEFVAR